MAYPCSCGAPIPTHPLLGYPRLWGAPTHGAPLLTGCTRSWGTPILGTPLRLGTPLVSDPSAGLCPGHRALLALPLPIAQLRARGRAERPRPPLERHLPGGGSDGTGAGMGPGMGPGPGLIPPRPAGVPGRHLGGAHHPRQRLGDILHQEPGAEGRVRADPCQHLPGPRRGGGRRRALVGDPAGGAGRCPPPGAARGRPLEGERWGRGHGSGRWPPPGVRDPLGVLCPAAPCSAVLCSDVQRHAALCRAVPPQPRHASCAMPHHAMSCHTTLCNAIPCHHTPCHATQPCHSMPCHPIPCHPAIPFHAMPPYSMPSSHSIPFHAMPPYAMPPSHAMPFHAMPCHPIPCHPAIPCHSRRPGKAPVGSEQAGAGVGKGRQRPEVSVRGCGGLGRARTGTRGAVPMPVRDRGARCRRWGSSAGRGPCRRRCRSTTR